MVSLRVPHSMPARARAGVASLTIHTLAVILLFTLASNPAARRVLTAPVRLVASSILAPYLAPAPVGHKAGGSGGDLSPLPASRGRLPRVATQVFTPPAVILANDHPALPVEPTILAPPDSKLPNVDLPQLGNPWSTATIPSNGIGCCSGIGDKRGNTVGNGVGDGVGDDHGPGVYAGRSRIGGGASQPVVVYSVEPEYSDDARKVKLQGIVVLNIEIDEQGRPRNLRVTRPLGLGLDERALAAVQQWRFRPAYRDGKPAIVAAIVEVNFRLL